MEQSRLILKHFDTLRRKSLRNQGGNGCEKERSGDTMDLDSVIKQVESLFLKWDGVGIEMIGETSESWIFKEKPIHGAWDPDCPIIVDKKDGKMRFLNFSRPEDREVAYNAKVIRKFT